MIEKLRISDPWQFKVPVLISVTYLIVFTLGIDFFVASKFICLSVVTILGIAAYAYLLNDWADEKADAAIGKVNVVAGLSLTQRLIGLVFFLATAVLPWFFFPYNNTCIGLLGAELLLFWMYSATPFRLKEKYLAGVIADALYAHAIPCLLAGFTFIEIAKTNGADMQQEYNRQVYVPLAALVAWQFILGIRNILLHQIADYANDLVSQTRTFATRFGIDRTEQWLVRFIIPTEIILLLIFFASLYNYAKWLCFCYLFFASYYVIRHGLKLMNYRNFCYQLLDDFYMDWWPLFVLVALAVNDIRFVLLLIVHVLLFRNFIRQQVLSCIK